MKRLKRLLAVIMAIICAGSIANFDVKAEGLKINEKHKKAKIIREIKELKTKTSSTYQLDNGARLLKVNLGSEDSEMEKNGGNLKKITKDGRKKLKELDVRNVSNYLMSNSSVTKKNYFPKELSETQGVVMENSNCYFHRISKWCNFSYINVDTFSNTHIHNSSFNCKYTCSE